MSAFCLFQGGSKRRFLAVRNKRKNTVELVEILPFVLSPDLWRERGLNVSIHDIPDGNAPEVAGEDDADKTVDEIKEEKRQKRMLLMEKTVMELGSKRRQRGLAAGKKGARGTLKAADLEDVAGQVADTSINTDAVDVIA